MFGSLVVVCDLLTENPYRTGFVFFPSDWFSFGRTEDVRKLWAAPPDIHHEIARYFENRPRPFLRLMPKMISCYNALKYIWLSALRTHATVDCEHWWDNTPENKRLTELTFATNPIFVDESRSGVTFCKYRPSRILHLMCYTDADRLTQIICRKVCVRLPRKLRWVGGPLGRN